MTSEKTKRTPEERRERREKRRLRKEREAAEEEKEEKGNEETISNKIETPEEQPLVVQKQKNRLNQYISSSMAHALMKSHVSSIFQLGIRSIYEMKSTTRAVGLKSDEMTIQFSSIFTDDLPEDPFIIHPMIRIHFIDSSSGSYLQKSKTKRPVINQYENTTAIPIHGTKRIESTCQHILPIITRPSNLTSEENQGAPLWDEILVVNEDYNHVMSSPSTLILFELLDFGPNLPPEKQHDGFYRAAWAFLRPIGSKSKEIRLQFYKYQPHSWLVETQAREAGLLRHEPSVPDVFLQYLRYSREKYPSTLHFSLSAQERLQPRTTTSRPEYPTDMEQHELSLVDLQTTKTTVNGPEASDLDQSGLEKYRREPTESCIVPQRLLYQLPSGSQGCVAIEFSHSGLSLAAACVDNQSFPIRIYDMETGAVGKTHRGHRGLVYSLKWSQDDQELVSCSADGTIRVWSSESTLILTQNPPSFVYCVEFHHLIPSLVFSGSFDHQIHMWDIESEQELGCFDGGAKSHEAEINSICFDGKNGRVFSGDGLGTILVWKAKGEGRDPLDYQHVRTIRAPDLSTAAITCLALHPKKNHLLVQTKGDVLRQYELRSYLLVNKGYPGAKCTVDRIQSCFSPDGHYLVSGSEDGTPCLFSSHTSQRLRGGPYTHLYGDSLFDCTWSKSYHLVAFCAFGGNHPVLILSALRSDETDLSESFHDELSRVELQERLERKKRVEERRRSNVKTETVQI